MVVKSGQQSPAFGIGRGAMCDSPFLLEGRIVHYLSLDLAKLNARTEVLLRREGGKLMRARARMGSGLVPAGSSVRGRVLRYERDIFLKNGTGRLPGRRERKGDVIRGVMGIAGSRRNSGRRRGGPGRSGRRGGGRRCPGRGDRRSRHLRAREKRGTNSEENEKAFHRYHEERILMASILKSESRWQGEIPPGMRPWEMTRRLAHLPDLIFLDSVSPRPRALSKIAAFPDKIVEGETPADWERLRATVAGRAGTPGIAAGYVEYEGRFRFGLYQNVLTFSHDDARWTDDGGLAEMADGPAEPAKESINFQPEMTQQDYEEIVRRAQEYIAAGDIYQVNLAHRFTGSWNGAADEALGFYGRLREISPAPYAGLMCGPDRVIASSSPELFLRMQGRDVLTRPIKGTRARGIDPAADAAAAAELELSAKERAELVMITDLERNDLGQVCEYGSVEARDLLRLERFAQVHHLVSTVAGRLRADVDHVAALRACFPGGSVTGAPKKRAREIIHELEPVDRSVYTGAMGYFGFDGTSAFNIAIRTVVLERNGRAHFHAGAGIVADSEPRREWEETMWKAAGLLKAASGRDR